MEVDHTEHGDGADRKILRTRGPGHLLGKSGFLLGAVDPQTQISCKQLVFACSEQESNFWWACD